MGQHEESVYEELKTKHRQSDPPMIGKITMQYNTINMIMSTNVTIVHVSRPGGWRGRGRGL